MNTRYGRNVCQDLANLSDKSVSGVRFNRLASKYAKAVQERKALEASYQDELKLNLPQVELVKQRIARELELENEKRLSTQPVASVFDAYSLAKNYKGASNDAGLRALTAQLEKMWNKDRSASLTAKSYKALHDHYRRNFPKSAAADVIAEVGRRGYTTLPVADLARIASTIETQEDFEKAMLYHGLAGKAPHQVKARQYILALLNEEDEKIGSNPYGLDVRQEPTSVSDLDPGIRYEFKFDNGYGASVIQTPRSYGGRDDKWGLATLKYTEDEPDGMLFYNNEICKIDVQGYLGPEEVQYCLDVIEAWPEGKYDAETGKFPSIDWDKEEEDTSGMTMYGNVQRHRAFQNEEDDDDEMEANTAEQLLNHIEEMEELVEDFAEEEGFEVEEEDDEYEVEVEEKEARRAQIWDDEDSATGTETYEVISIDAWGNETDGWDWNDMYSVGQIEMPRPEEIQDDSVILKALVDAGIASEKVFTKCEVDDSDGIQWVVQVTETGQPLWSIRYDGVEDNMLGKSGGARDPFFGRTADDSGDPLMEGELFDFILTYSEEGQALAGRRQAIENNLKKKKLDKGIYDSQLAAKGFMYLVEDAIQEYARQFYGNDYGSGKNLLSPQSRMNVAAMLVEEFEANNSGNDEESTGDMEPGMDRVSRRAETSQSIFEESDPDSLADSEDELDWNLYVACLKEIGAGGIAEYFFRYLSPSESNMVLKSLIRENRLFVHTDPETGATSLTDDPDQGSYMQNLRQTIANSAANSNVFVGEVLRSVKPSRVSSILMRMALTRKVSYTYHEATRKQAVDNLYNEFAQQQQSGQYMIDPPWSGTLAIELETWAGKTRNDASKLAQAWMNGDSVPGDLVLGAVSYLESLASTLGPDDASAVQMLIGELQDHVMEQKATDRSVQGRTFQALLHCVACGW